MLHKQNIQDIYELSPMQKGMYFHALLDRSADPYFSQTSYVVAGNLNPVLMEESLNLLVKRHDVLRTIFNHKKADEIIQVVLKEVPAQFEYLDVRELSDSAKVIFIDNYKTENRQRGFNLNKDRLLRLALIHTGGDAYELVWSTHHIIMDGWCHNLLVGEFQEIYLSLTQGETPQLPPTCQYRNYIDWIGQQEPTKARAFWNNYLKDYQAQHRLFQGNTTSEDYDNQELELKLSLELSEQLRKVGNEYGLTLSVLLQTAWGLVLSKYQSSEDALFGLVSTIRPAEIPNIDQAVGLFINTIPIRIQCPKNRNFIDLATEVQQNQAQVQANAFLPISDIQKESELKQRLIDHAFIFESFPPTEDGDKASEQSLDIPQIAYQGGYAQTNYNFNLITLPNPQISFKFNYNGQCLAQTFIAGLAEHFEYLLEQIAAQPQRLIQDFRLLRKTAASDLLDRNGTWVDYQAPSDAYTCFYRQVNRDPEALALLDEDTAWSYQDLAAKANQVACHLKQKVDFEPGKIVAVYLDRSPASIAALLGIWQVGGVYLPLSTDQPPARIKNILDAAQPVALLCKSEELAYFGAWDELLIPIETCWQEDVPVLPAVTRQPEDLAYLIFTSGTTGRPKGVPIRQESIINQILFHNEYLDLKVGDRFLHLASLAFDASLVEILMPLFAGGTVVVAAPALKENTDKLLAFLREQKVNAAIFPPAYLRLLKQIDQTQLKQIISTGEAILTEDAIQFSRALEIYNGYGPTECCIGATFHKVTPEREQMYMEAGSIPIGQPFANCSVYIVNHHLELLPPGQIGEIYVAGIGLSKGYWNAADATAAAFSTNPYARQRTEQIWYRTGDLGRWNAQGEIEFCGRVDHQVQLNGIRVEPQEIAARILQMEKVKRALVDLVTHEGRTTLTAFVETKESLTANLIQDYLRPYLPNYMIPRHIQVLSTFPLTPNGKVDQQALLAQVATAKNTQVGEDLPKTELEKMLCGILAKTLRRDQIYLDTDFFQIGGDSIKAIQIVSRLYRDGYALEVKDIFNYPIVRQMLTRIQRVQSLAEQGIIKGTQLLTPIQEEFFALNLPHPHHFNHAELFKSELPLEERSVRKVLQKLVSHHDALRIAFSQKAEGSWQGRIEDDRVSFRLMCFDLREEKEVEAKRRELCQMVQSNFQLEAAPLLAAAIIREATGDQLLVVIHHLVIDGISWRIFLEDLQLLFEQLGQGETLSLPPKTDSFQLWAEQLHARANSEAMLPELTYWSAPNMFDAHPLPTEKLKDQGIQQFTFQLGHEQTQQLRTQVHRAYATEMNPILLSALSLAVERVWGIQQLAVMQEGHGREELFPDLNISRTIGWFTSLFPVVLDNTVAPNDIGGLIRETKRRLKMLPNRGIGYGMIKQLREEGKSLLPLEEPNVLFNYLGVFEAPALEEALLQTVDADLGHSSHPDNKPTFPLMITALVEEGQLEVSFQYNSALFAEAKIEQFVEQYEVQLQRLIQHCLEVPYEKQTEDLTYSDLPISVLANLQQKYRNQGHEIQDVYPLSPMQEAMYFQALANPGSTAYFYQASYPLKGYLQLDLVEQSLHQLMDRHDVLRTVFQDKISDRNLQIVLTDLKSPIQYVDLQKKTPTQQTEAINTFLAEDRQNLFDLSSGPLVRVAILQKTNDQFVLVFTSHHILMDGWCFAVLMEEFLKIYQGLIEAKPVNLPQPRPYRHFIQWLEEQDLSEAENYWEGYLEGFDRPSKIKQVHRLPEQSDAFELRQSKIPFSLELTERVYAQCQNWHITPSIFLQSIWGLLLARYRYTNDVVFGKTVSGRPTQMEGIETMTGLFVNTIPVRVNYEATDTFLSILKKQQTEYLESQDYHYCSFNRIQSLSSLKNQLLDHSFVVQNIDQIREESKTNGLWEVDGEIRGYEHANFDLCVVAYTADRINIDLEYNALVLDQAYMEQLGRHFLELVKNVLAQPERPIASIGLQQPMERLFVDQINDTQRTFEAQTILDSLFLHAAEKPEALALQCLDKTLSYQSLEQQSNQLAHYLIREHQIAKGSIVALRMERSIPAILTMIGILKTGASYVAIDRSFPHQRMQFILEDSQAQLLVFDFDDMESGACPKLNWQDIDLNPLPSTRPKIAITPQDIMYTIYTSGSTGQPKGVQIKHASLFNYLKHNQESYQVVPRDRTLLMSSMAFDLSYSSIWQPLAAGGAQVIMPENDYIDIELLLKVLEEDQISILKITPTALKLLVNDPRFLLAVGDFQLRLILIGGEKIRLEDLEKYLEMATIPVAFVDEYGPTEATIGTANFWIDKHNIEELLTEPLEGSNIGRPIANTQLHLLDYHDQEAGMGMIGEICIAGMGLAEGYWNRAELTQEKFVSHPQRPGLRVYRTGDLGRWLPDGNVEFLGRKDTQVKVRGYRIELQEIEAVIRQHETIEDVVVTPLIEEKGTSIVAYVLPHADFTKEKIRAYLEEVMPIYMMPHFWVRMESFPQTLNGKIAIKALPNPHENLQKQKAEWEAAKSPEEKILVEAFEKAMQLERVGMNDNFFTLGGDSIMAMQIIAHLYQAGYQLEIREIFLHPQPSKLVHYLSLLEKSNEDADMDFDDFEGIESEEMDLINQIINN